jgi:hypothetical protein
MVSGRPESSRLNRRSSSAPLLFEQIGILPAVAEVPLQEARRACRALFRLGHFALEGHCRFSVGDGDGRRALSFLRAGIVRMYAEGASATDLEHLLAGFGIGQDRMVALVDDERPCTVGCEGGRGRNGGRQQAQSSFHSAPCIDAMPPIARPFNPNLR